MRTSGMADSFGFGVYLYMHESIIYAYASFHQGAEMELNGICSCTALRKASRRVSQLYDEALAPCGLRTTQRAILNHIRRAGTPSIGALAEALVMDRGALTH